MLSAAAILGAVAIATPAQAKLLSFDIDYTGWFEAEGGGDIFGSIRATEEAAADGFISADELTAWTWSWSGNDFVSAFSIASEDADAGFDFLDGFYVDGTPNVPGFDGVDQGTFFAGAFAIDFEELRVEDNTVAFPFGGDATFGDAFATTGSVAVSDPAVVPEPATVLGLLALAGVGATVKRQQRSA